MARDVVGEAYRFFLAAREAARSRPDGVYAPRPKQQGVATRVMSLFGDESG